MGKTKQDNTVNEEIDRNDIDKKYEEYNKKFSNQLKGILNLLELGKEVAEIAEKFNKRAEKINKSKSLPETKKKRELDTLEKDYKKKVVPKAKLFGDQLKEYLINDTMYNYYKLGHDILNCGAVKGLKVTALTAVSAWNPILGAMLVAGNTALENIPFEVHANLTNQTIEGICEGINTIQNVITNRSKPAKALKALTRGVSKVTGIAGNLIKNDLVKKLLNTTGVGKAIQNFVKYAKPFKEVLDVGVKKSKETYEDKSELGKSIFSNITSLMDNASKFLEMAVPIVNLVVGTKSKL